MGEPIFQLTGTRVRDCKYGENAWQSPAVLYRTTDDALAIHNFKQISGSDPSLNSFLDVDRALQTLTHIQAAFQQNGLRKEAALAVKHGNACGASCGAKKDEVIEKAIWGDTRAIFGGLVMTTFEIDEMIAEKLLRYQVVKGKRALDGVVAPSFTPEAIELLGHREKCRLLTNEMLQYLTSEDLNFEVRIRPVRGGFLLQPNYTYILNLNDPRLERYGDVTPTQENDLRLAWAIGSTSNSNTITIVKNDRLIGNGVGQQDRVGCCELAIKRARDAGHEIEGSVAYSDSFFPFPDGPEALAAAGVKAILTSSGSQRDDETKAACTKNGVSLLMFPDVLGRGFYGH